MDCEITPIRRIVGHHGPLYAICVTAEGVYSGGADNQLVFHPHDDQQPSQLLATFNESIFSIQKTGRFVCVGSFSGHCYQINLSSLQVTKWQAHQGPIFAIESLKEDWMATAGADGKIHIWDLVTSKIIRTVWLGDFKIRSLHFSKDDNTLLVGCGNGALVILDFPWFNTLHEWKIQDDACYGAVHYPEKKIWISAHKSGQLQFWKSEESHSILQLQVHLGSVYGIQLDRKNGVIYTISQDKSLKVWSLESLTLLNKWDNWEGQSYRSINKMELFEDKLILAGDNSKIDVLKICFFR